jgi:SMC interacting uncharacterized protein involved in chromosome segregation
MDAGRGGGFRQVNVRGGASMFNIQIIIATVVAVGAFGFGLFTGYKIEAGKVAKLEGELHHIEDTAKAANDKLVATQTAMDAKLAEQTAAYQRDVEKLEQDEAAKHISLQQAIAGKDQRIAAIEAQRKELAAKLTAAQDRLNKAATPEEKEKAKADLDILTNTGVALELKESGEKCMDAPIPKEVIDSLNKVSS